MLTGGPAAPAPPAGGGECEESPSPGVGGCECGTWNTGIGWTKSASDLKSGAFRYAFVMNIIMSSICDRPLNWRLGQREIIKVRKNNKELYTKRIKKLL